MKIGFVQFNPEFGHIDKNLKKIIELVQDAKAQNPDLLVFPELSLSGYSIPDKKSAIALSQEIPGPFTRQLTGLAKKSGCYIVVGMAEKSGDDIFNSSVYLGQQGIIAVYRKTHLFWNEFNIFKPGNTGFHSFPIKKTRMGIMICFDWAFPESAGTLARNGARIIAHPSNLILPYAFSAVPVRAIENRVFIITANRWGTEKTTDGELTFRGESLIVAPNGEILAKAPEDKDCIRIVEIDPEEANNKKLNPVNDVIKDRREELYS